MQIKSLTKIEFFLALLLSVSVIGLIFPYRFPLFFCVGLIYFILFLMKKKISIYLNGGLVLFYLFSILYIWGILITAEGINSLIISSLSNLAVLLMTLCLYGNTSEKTVENTKKKFFLILSIVTPILSLFTLYKYVLLLGGRQLNFLMIEGRHYPWGTSLMPDYNMFALGMLICLIASLYIIKNARSSLYKFYCLTGVLLAFLSIILSGSRRGLILLLVLLVYFIIYLMLIFLKSSFSGRMKAILAVVIISFAVTILSSNFDIRIVDEYEIEKLKYRYSTINQFESSFSERTERWQYTYDIVSEYSPIELFLGSGFDYHTLYGKKFNVESGIDYPHNIFISTFLYSGVVGLSLLIIIVCLPIISIIKKKILIKEELLVIYLLCIVFFFVSADSLFSINILWLISSLFICTKTNMGNFSRIYRRGAI